MYERPCRPREYAAVLGLPSMEHATRQHANLGHGCPLQTTDSDEYGGPAPFSEAEARIIKLIAEDSPLRSFVNMHSGEYALYAPWDSQQKLAVGQPVGPGFFILAAAAASENFSGPACECGIPLAPAAAWRRSLWDVHAGPLLLQCATAAAFAKQLAYWLHAGVCTCCLLLPKPDHRCKEPAKGPVCWLVLLLTHCCWLQTCQHARGFQHVWPLHLIPKVWSDTELGA